MPTHRRRILLMTISAGRTVVALFEKAGFAAIDLGDLATGARCCRFTTRSPASTRSGSEERPPMAVQTKLTPAEAADRLASSVAP